MKTICVYTGSRADWGPLEVVAKRIRDGRGLRCLIETSPEHILLDHQTPNSFSAFGNPFGAFWAASSGCCASCADHQDYDLLLVLGDRLEVLQRCLIESGPIAHIHGGEITHSRDEAYRHCITKLSHIHFAATQKAGERIRRLGEDPAHVHVVGAPGLDDLPTFDEPRTDEILVCMHPVSTRSDADNEDTLNSVLMAVRCVNLRVCLMAPNGDPGGAEMRRLAHVWGAGGCLPRAEYLHKLATCACAVGNSSSFLIEAPFYGTPVVNVGERQRGRERALNVLDVGANAEAISKGIERVMLNYLVRLSNKAAGCPSPPYPNPYGDGHASEGIVKILEDLDLSKLDVQKEWHE